MPRWELLWTFAKLVLIKNNWDLGVATEGCTQLKSWSLNDLLETMAIFMQYNYTMKMLWQRVRKKEERKTEKERKKCNAWFYGSKKHRGRKSVGLSRNCCSAGRRECFKLCPAEQLKVAFERNDSEFTRLLDWLNSGCLRCFEEGWNWQRWLEDELLGHSKLPKLTKNRFTWNVKKTTSLSEMLLSML